MNAQLKYITVRPVDAEPLKEDRRALREFLKLAQGEPEPVEEDWRDVAADEAGVPRFGEI